MQQLNDKEIEAEARIEFNNRQEAMAEKWRQKGRAKPGKPASWEVFWEAHRQKRNGKYKGGIDNIRYTHECLIPYLIPYIHVLNESIHEPDEFEYDT